MVTIVSLFIGREYCIRQFLRSLGNLNYPKKELNLIWHDTSHNNKFHKILERWLEDNGDLYKSVKYIVCDKPHYHFEMGENQALGAITEAYNHCLEFFDDDYLFALEDDVVIPKNALSKLLKNVKGDVVASAGLIRARPSNKWHVGSVVGWNFEIKEIFPGERIESAIQECVIKKDGKGKQFVGSAHLGCTLIDGEFIKKHKFKKGKAGCDVQIGIDAYYDKKKYIFDWTIKCKHFDVDRKWY